MDLTPHTSHVGTIGQFILLTTKLVSRGRLRWEFLGQVLFGKSCRK